ncbi:hypothetical protein HS088_TW12G00376 [Tripterygium wilfordii]|uniref:Non-haem dioxygenase N-terminal domain-containing protein n=1 Tax=Tripterygium wilfordii TaxID=458696 RepID=A0A7J7CYJ0_TRIWF|nr:gibberellin 3-beta-dioxygenase 4 [Tripterygium wilfordii]KAF5739175.1 hypothetical protein HS088_TW12G00376 [Tripterygium wilfordii]
MATSSPESMPERVFEFRAPPPSPIASGRRSSVTNDEFLSEFLERSLRVPDLVLPDKIFPKQKIVETPPRIDLSSLNSAKDVGSINSKIILDSIARIGCFQLVNHGISGGKISSTLGLAAEIFGVPPEKKAAVTRVPEKLFGFEEVHSGEECGLSEEFVWCNDESLKLDMEGIWPAGYSKFSEKMKSLSSDMENFAEKILQVIWGKNLNKQVYQNELLQRQEFTGTICHLYKHNCNISADQRATSLRYDVIRTLIRGIEHSHALCLHICNGSSEFHVYSKKDWITFLPDKDSIIVTVGDQIQTVSGGQYKHVIGRPLFKDEEEDCISMAFLYSPTVTNNYSCRSTEEGKTISVAKQAIAAIIFTLIYQFLVYIYKNL